MNTVHRLVMMPEPLAKRLLKQSGLVNEYKTPDEAMDLVLNLNKDSNSESTNLNNSSLTISMPSSITKQKKVKVNRSSSPFHASDIEKFKALISNEISVNEKNEIIPKKRNKPIFGSDIFKIFKHLQHETTARKKRPRGINWVLKAAKKKPESLELINNQYEKSLLNSSKQRYSSKGKGKAKKPLIPSFWIPWPKN